MKPKADKLLPEYKIPAETSSGMGYVHSAQFSNIAGNNGKTHPPNKPKTTTRAQKLSRYNKQKHKMFANPARTMPTRKAVKYAFVTSKILPMTPAPINPHTMKTAPKVPASSLL